MGGVVSVLCLVDTQLLQTPHPDRYQFHDMLRLYARELAAARAGQ